jgi:uncharacterized short protein YbdD (DUF466 family)
MSDEMKLWNSVCETDPDSTKQVNDGRRRFTAIDAYSQIKRATELWGPYGGKWKLTDVEIGEGPARQLCCLKGTFVYPGGDFFVMNAIKHTSNQDIVDADCLKKLETDTITKALSKLGFNADVFLGLYDDNRYVQEMREKNATQPPDAHADYKSKAEAAIAAHPELMLEPKFAEWVNACSADGFWKDIYNAIADIDKKGQQQ